VSKRLIRLSSRALGDPCHVRVYVYDDLEHMRRDAVAFTGDQENADAMAVTHRWHDEQGRTSLITMRLWRGCLGTEVVTHEMSHASTALYGATLPDKVDRDEVFTHYNEPFAYLHGELTRRLVDRLYALGYYDQP
jgi:hypothetical protein